MQASGNHAGAVTVSLVRSLWRFIRVGITLIPLIGAYLRDRRRFVFAGRSRTVDTATHRRRASQLVDSCIKLGPTFIKLGQLLSTRPDVVPPTYIEVLSQLQDDVPPAPWNQTKRVIEADIGAVDTHFDSFDTEPISGASLGQVYRASVDGADVAVKVRRPGVTELVRADIRAIRWGLRLVLPFVDDARAFSIRNLADEFERTVLEEMDYDREREMLQRIRANFREDPHIHIPAVIESHSTARVLTMQYVEGTKITHVDELDAHGIDRSEVAERLHRAYFKMILEDGVYHADPHPGNLAVKPDGTIVFYDFGMSGVVDGYLQQKIIDFYLAVAQRDIDAILDILIEVGTLSPDADRAVMAELMEVAIEDYRGRSVERYQVQHIIGQLENSMYEFPFRLPANLALLLRVATVVEGVCVTLDADYDFIEVASAYLIDAGFQEKGFRQAIEMTTTEVEETARASIRLPRKLDRTLDQLERGSIHVDATLTERTQHFERLAKRIVLGLLLSAIIVACAILLAANEQQLAVGFAGAGVLVALLLLWSLYRPPPGRGPSSELTRHALEQRYKES